MIKPSEQELEQLLSKYRNNAAMFMYHFTNLFTDADGTVQELYPKQIEFMNLISPKDKVVAVVKSRQCLHKNTFIYTEHGPKTVEQLFNEKYSGKVWTNDQSGNAKLDDILDIWKTGQKEVYEIKLWAGEKILLTAEHEVMTDEGWKKTKELKKGDIVWNSETPFGDLDVSDEEAALMGYFITDGSYSSGSPSFCNNNIEYVEEFERCVTSLFDVALTRTYQKQRPKATAVNVVKPSRKYSNVKSEYAQYLTDLGCRQTHAERVLPEKFLKMKKHPTSVMLNRIFAGDGWYAGNGTNKPNSIKKKKPHNEIGLGSPSLEFIHQVSFLLNKFGIHARIEECMFKKSFYKLRFAGREYIEIFEREIGIFGKKMRFEQKPEHILHKSRNRIKSITKIDGLFDTYDIETKKYNSFIANGIHVHNCLRSDTMVMTEFGEISIEKLANMEQRPAVHAGVDNKLCKVLDGWKSGVKKTFEIFVSNGTSVNASVDHKFAVKRKSKLKWVPVGELKVGDELYHLRNRALEVEPAFVVNVVDTGVESEMYDLEIEGEHSFFANKILVHNCGITTSIIGKTIHDAYFYKVPATLITSAGQRQSVKVLDKVKKAIDSMPEFMRPKLKRSTNEEIIFESGAEITSLPVNPDTSRGYSGNVIMDEFGVLSKKDSEQMWEAVYPSISKGWRISCVSSPKGTDNVFYHLCNPVIRDGKNVSSYQADKILSIHWTDVPHIKSFVEKEKVEDKTPPKLFAQEYCCEFVGDNEESFFDLENVRDKMIDSEMSFDKIGTIVNSVGNLIPSTFIKTDLNDKYPNGIYVGYDPATTIGKYTDQSVVVVLGNKIDGTWDLIAYHAFPVGTQLPDQVDFVIRLAKTYQARKVGLDASGGFGLSVKQWFEDKDYGYKLAVHKFTNEFKLNHYSHLRQLVDTGRFKSPKDDMVYRQFSKIGFNPVTNRIAAMGRSEKDDLPSAIICALAAKEKADGFDGFAWL